LEPSADGGELVLTNSWYHIHNGALYFHKWAMTSKQLDFVFLSALFKDVVLFMIYYLN
jgi:hypothetical protein